MANNGPDLINALVNNATLMALDNCPAVPVHVGAAVCGSIQNDDKGVALAPGKSLKDDIARLVYFSGITSETSVWHFSTGAPVHHFVVVPWYKHDYPHGWVYTVFMAYENHYTVQQYVAGAGGSAPAHKPGGYKPFWSATELSDMLYELLTGGSAWETYFGSVGAAKTLSLTCYKYKVVSLVSAIRQVTSYTQL